MRQVNNILKIRNGLNTLTTLNLPLQFKVHIWRKKKNGKTYTNLL
jgi:hypothetical protein